MTDVDLAARLKLHRSRNEWRGTCPCCGYANAFVLSVGKAGRLLGWCASCENKREIAQLLAQMQGGGAAPEQAERPTTRRSKRLGARAGHGAVERLRAGAGHARRALLGRSRVAASRRIGGTALPPGLSTPVAVPAAGSDRARAGRQRGPGRHPPHLSAA